LEVTQLGEAGADGGQSSHKRRPPPTG
jgi:hypothetical protein